MSIKIVYSTCLLLSSLFAFDYNVCNGFYQYDYLEHLIEKYLYDSSYPSFSFVTIVHHTGSSDARYILFDMHDDWVCMHAEHYLLNSFSNITRCTIKIIIWKNTHKFCIFFRFYLSYAIVLKCGGDIYLRLCWICEEIKFMKIWWFV